jgi:hypothetical protein
MEAVALSEERIPRTFWEIPEHGHVVDRGCTTGDADLARRHTLRERAVIIR